MQHGKKEEFDPRTLGFLSEDGVEQVSSLAEALKQSIGTPNAIYTSLAPRSIQTAEVLIKHFEGVRIVSEGFLGNTSGSGALDLGNAFSLCMRYIRTSAKLIVVTHDLYMRKLFDAIVNEKRLKVYYQSQILQGAHVLDFRSAAPRYQALDPFKLVREHERIRM